MSAYDVELTLHSWLRWALLVLLTAVTFRSFFAMRGRALLTRTDDRLHVAAIGLADLQLTLGLLLYFFESPWTQAFRAAPGPSMKNSVLRFFAVEHLAMMLVGIALLHAGRVLAKRTPEAARPRRVFRYTLAALLFILGGIPWPFLPAGRPLFRVHSGDEAGADGSVVSREPGPSEEDRGGALRRRLG